MQLIQSGKLAIFFGDAATSVDPELFVQVGCVGAHDLPGIKTIRTALGARLLVLPHQIHTANMLVLRTEQDLQVALAGTHDDRYDADIIMTNLPRVAIGVLTADCLPIVLYAPDVQAFVVVHAGWRGTHQQVVMQAIRDLQKEYDADPAGLHAWCGPCAHVDAYVVGEDFRAELALGPCARHTAQVLENRAGTWHYNLLKHNILQLQEAGIPASQIDSTPSVCTITDTRYCSYRRERERAQRQITAACLCG